MKVLQVHGIDHNVGGAVLAMHSLHHGLQKAGIDSRILCGRPTRSTSVAMPHAPLAERVLGHVTLRLGLNDVHCVGAFRIKQVPAFQEADVVHFHAMHGQFFSYLALPTLTAEKATVFTLHDMWALTGHCAVNYDCERWRSGCGHCPYPTVGPPLPGGRDGTRLEWKLKRWVYRHAHLTLVALSTRMLAQLQQSILSHLPVCHIPNGVDTTAYQPLDPAMCRAALGLPAHKKVVLFAAGHLTRQNKGGAVLLKALQDMPRALQKELVLLLMGEGGDVLASATDLDVWTMGYVGGVRLKTLLYNAADLFVLPSFGESFGLVWSASCYGWAGAPCGWRSGLRCGCGAAGEWGGRMDLVTRGIAKSREVWARGWMRLAGVPGVGRLAMGVAAWAMPPYRGRVPLSAMHQRGYIAPSARLYHRQLHLGPHVFIGAHVLIYQVNNDSGPVDLGRRVRLHQDVIVETGTGGSLRIGEESNILPRCQLSAYQGPIDIGRGVSMAPYCALYPYDHGILPELPIRKQPLRSRGGIVIGDEVWLGVGVIVLDGVRIGAGAVVGAGSVVAHDVPDGAVVQGVPARVVMFRSDLASRTLAEQAGLSFPQTAVCGFAHVAGLQ